MSDEHEEANSGNSIKPSLGFSYDARSGGGGADDDGGDGGGGRRWSDDFNGFGARAFFQVRPSVTPARYLPTALCFLALDKLNKNLRTA